jgi:peptide/nickel transport system permease protein
VSVLLLVLLAALFGPAIAPQEQYEYNFDDDGDLLVAEGPSVNHPLGTTATGQDVFSLVLIGARPTLIAGLLGGAVLITLGSLVGITAGYKGGLTDSLLMRFTDLVYGLPLIPFAIVMVAFFGTNFYTTILIIGAILWRASARVLRSQVLQIKQREFITATKAEGASSFYIITRHILPNLFPMMAFFFAVGVGGTIIAQASLAFIGVSNPFVPSWGVMIRNAYDAGHIDSWWWSLPPGLLISAVVYSSIMLGRSIEATEGSTESESLAGV